MLFIQVEVFIKLAESLIEAKFSTKVTIFVGCYSSCV